MTSRFGIPRGYKSRPQQSILNLISGCSFSFHRPFVTACWTHDPTEATWSPSTCFSFTPLPFLPSLKSIELIFPPWPLKTSRRRLETDEGPALTHSNAFHLLQVNSNWLVTFTYHQMQWNHSKWKRRTCLARLSNKHIPSETYLILHVSLLLCDKVEEKWFCH